MIVVTVGTNEQPFDRLVRAAAALGGDRPLLVQHGASKVPHGRGEWVDFLSFDELEQRMRAADAVVCHAGVGSIMLARRCGHRPIVVARRGHLGEAVDDHQLPIAQRLASDGLVTLVDDVNELEAAIARAHPPHGHDGEPSPERGGLPGKTALAADMRALLDGFGARRLARGRPSPPVRPPAHDLA